MSVIAQGVATELMSVIERVGKLSDDEDTFKAFADAVCSVNIDTPDMQQGIIRVQSMFKLDTYEVADDAE